MPGKEFEYYNFLVDGESFDTPMIAFDDLLLVFRNGIEIPFTDATLLSETVNVSVLSFRKKSRRTIFVMDEDKYTQLLFSVVNPPTYRYDGYLIGPTVEAGDVYTYTVNGVIASYTVLGGDTNEDVRDGLVAAVNGTSFNAPTVAAPLPGTDSLLIQTDDYLYTPVLDILTTGRYLFEVGYYCSLEVLGITYDFLIYYDSDDFGYPSLPGVSASYAYGSLTIMLAGISAYLANFDYTPISYSTTAAGTADITGVPSATGLSIDGCAYDDVNFKLIVGLPMNVGETFKLIYR